MVFFFCTYPSWGLPCCLALSTHASHQLEDIFSFSFLHKVFLTYSLFSFSSLSEMPVKQMFYHLILSQRFLTSSSSLSLSSVISNLLESPAVDIFILDIGLPSFQIFIFFIHSNPLRFFVGSSFSLSLELN